MARFLVVSSQVVRGAVGLSVIAPALQQLGHEILGLPAILLSNHAGHRIAAGLPIPVGQLFAMLDALEANGWLSGLDGVLTGYLPTDQHVGFAAAAIDRVLQSSPEALILCDPVLGDDPKGLYVGDAAANAIRRELVPRAHLATPNRFELAFLTGRRVAGIDDASRALMCLDCGGGIATSIPAAADMIANVAVIDDTIAVARVPRRDNAQNGTGDLLAAVVLHALATGAAPETALSQATSAADAALAASRGGDVLRVPRLPETFSAPWPTQNWSRRATTHARNDNISD